MIFAKLLPHLTWRTSEEVVGARFTADVFPTLDGRPLLGRTFLEFPLLAKTRVNTPAGD
jgi:hypothetical protein